jgi:hypothetical protein
MTPEHVRVRSLPSAAESARIGFEGEIQELHAGQTIELEVSHGRGDGDAAVS